MSDLKLDTSGSVPRMNPHGTGKSMARPDWQWFDLTPFVRGYIEAMFDTPVGPSELWVGKTFSDLAPVTLAQTIADCGRTYTANRYARYSDALQRHCGATFWATRQDRRTAHFPPLTVYLGEDGLIYLRDGAA